MILNNKVIDSIIKKDYMKITIKKIGFMGSILALIMIGSTSVMALPPQASAHAQSANNSNVAIHGNNISPPNQNANQGLNGQSNGQAHLAAGQLKACQNRQNAINNIMSRIDTRALNQVNLFSTIASRVEAFYTKQGKTLSNYSQLVAAVNTTEKQAETDFSTLKTNSTFSCSVSNPKGMVTDFQSYLKTEISDLQNFRTAVKNLIVGVASVNGVNLSSTSQTSSTGGGQ